MFGTITITVPSQNEKKRTFNDQMQQEASDFWLSWKRVHLNKLYNFYVSAGGFARRFFSRSALPLIASNSWVRSLFMHFVVDLLFQFWMPIFSGNLCNNIIKYSRLHQQTKALGQTQSFSVIFLVQMRMRKKE